MQHKHEAYVVTLASEVASGLLSIPLAVIAGIERTTEMTSVCREGTMQKVVVKSPQGSLVSL